VNRSDGDAWRFIGKPFMGSGEETGVIFPKPRKGRIFKLMPQRIGGSPIHETLGDEFKVRRGFTKGKTIKIPAE
jgi:hypothetical protein